MDYTLDDVRGMTAKSYSLEDVQAMRQPAKPNIGIRGEGFDAAMGYTGADQAGGFLRGAGSLGATLARPFESKQSNNDRRANLDSSISQLTGSNPDSLGYKTMKLGGEIAGTMGLGGGAANLLGRIPALAKYAAPLLESIGSAGMRAGGTTGMAALGARVGGGAAVGGASAGLVNPDDAGLGAVVGGGLPGAMMMSGAAGRGIRGALGGGAATPEVAALAGRAQDLGIKIPADRLGNSRPVNALASSLNYMPFSGRAATEDAMNSQLNKALSKTFGEDSSNVTQALRQAGPKLGGEFDRVLKSNTVRVDQQFMQDLAESANRASNELGRDGAGIIGKQVDDIISKAGTGEIDGQAAYNIKKTLDRIGRRTTPEAFYANDMRKQLMGALDRSLGPQEAAKFASTRQQYGNMLDLQKLAKNGAEGEVSVARLANMSNINNPQMQELADIAAQFVKAREGQHGAAQRVMMGTGAGIAGFLGGGVLGSGLGLLGAAGFGRGANSLLNSNAARNFMLQSSPQFQAGLLSESALKAAPVVYSQP